MEAAAQGWVLLQKVVLLLLVAFTVGVTLRRLGQNVIVGYLLTGLLLGPSGLGLLKSAGEIRMLSEVGVTLLLFSVGLEFSWRRLIEIGRVATAGGALQITTTAGAVFLICRGLGIYGTEALVVACAVAMSSTSVVVKVLFDRAELDSLHGRSSIGILLFQDLAVIPLLVVIEGLGAGGASSNPSKFALRVAGVAAATLVVLLLARRLVPRTALTAAASGSRDLPVLLAVVVSLGAAWGTNALGLPAALGAFAAGMLLAESPFAEQIRADMAPLGTVFITIFFAAVGAGVLLRGPADLWRAALASLGLLALKSVFVVLSVWPFQRSLRVAVATGIALSQVGEFTFVLAEAGFQAGLVRAEVFQVLLASSMMTLILTPYLIGLAPGLSLRVVRRLPRKGRAVLEEGARKGRPDRVLVVGYGPAGQQVVEKLKAQAIPFLVVDMNPHTVAANRPDLPIEFGDASKPEILHHLRAAHARAVVITIPDPAVSRIIVGQLKKMAPKLPVFVRSRYHLYSDQLALAGADYVVDEEVVVGEQFARRVLRLLEEAGRRPAGVQEE